MTETDDLGNSDPVITPRVVRLLKNRPRLIDRGLRKEALEELEIAITERRKPKNVSKEVVHSAFKRASEVGTGAAQKPAEKALEKGNKTILKRL